MNPRKALTELWQELDARIETGPARTQALSDARIALFVSTLALAAHYILAIRPAVYQSLQLTGTQWSMIWCASQWLFFVLLPALVAKLVMGTHPLDLGCRLKDARGHWPLYLFLFAVTLFCAIGVSGFESFSQYYPINKTAAASWHSLVQWEAIYALQFVAVEFFFRGFMLRTCERALGSTAIFVAVLPYCLFHATKPLPEFLGSIVAGIVLGTIALRTRSLWGGVILHISVAWGMDAMVLWRTGRFPPF